MIDREKVKKRLRDLRRYLEDREWSDNRGDRQAAKVYWQTVTDAIALLKEQEAVKPHYNARTNWYECGACHYSMTSWMHCRSELIPATKVRYCANCGFPVNWEGR